MQYHIIYAFSAFNIELTSVLLCHYIGMDEHSSILPTIGIMVFNILRFTALCYADYKHALSQCPGLHQPILHNRTCQPTNCQKAVEYIQLIQQVCTLTVSQVQDTRCLTPTGVPLMVKLKQDATSELGRQLYKKSLSIYGVRTIIVHDIMKK